MMFPIKCSMWEVGIMDCGLSREDIKENLKDIGCNHQQIQNFFRCYDKKDKKRCFIFYDYKEGNYWKRYISNRRKLII